MPIEFLTEDQQSQYGCYSSEPNDAQLARYFLLDSTALELINKRRRNYNRLGFALQLTTVRFLGTFLPNPIAVPSRIRDFLSQQLNADVEDLEQYMERKVTRYAHVAEIQDCYGYHEFNTAPWKFRLSRLLYT